MPRKTVPPAQRFWPKIDTSPSRGPNGECHEWTAGRNKKGYGAFYPAKGQQRTAHSYAWELRHGPIPDGLEVCHHCDNPPCCRDEHHFLGTRKDNLQDCIRKGRFKGGAHQHLKTHCPQGHPYSGDNLYLRNGRRHCRACLKARKNKAKAA